MQTTEHLETVVIGGGQAGLSTGYHLAKRHRPFIILDAHRQVGDGWRGHYDSLRLYSPACADGLPGMEFPGDRLSYPTKDEMADFLEAYAKRFELPVRSGIRIDALAENDGGFAVTAGDQRIEATNVVVATGTFGKPHIPAFAFDLDPEIVQLHSSDYQRPSQLAPGAVLVVGAAHSGADLALEVATAGHHTMLCGPDRGQIGFFREAKPATAVFCRVAPFVATRVLTVGTPIGRRARPKIRSHGGPLLRVKRADLAAAGVERVLQKVAGARRRAPGARRWSGNRSRQCHLGDRVPAGLLLDRPAHRR